MGGPDMAPHTPPRSERLGEAGAPLDTPARSERLGEAGAPLDTPARSERLGEAGAPLDDALRARAVAHLEAFERRALQVDGRRAAAVAVVLLGDEAGRY